MDRLSDRSPVVVTRMGDLWDALAPDLDPLPYMPIALGLHDGAMALRRKAQEKALSPQGQRKLARRVAELVIRTMQGGW